MPDARQQGQVALRIAEDLQHMADRVREQARHQLDSGQIPLTDYYTISERCQELQRQAAQVALLADKDLAVEVHGQLGALHGLTQRLRESLVKLQRIERALDILLKVTVAVGAVAMAAVNPGLSTIAGAAAALADVGQGVAEQIK